jgi:hypothetical protein
MMSFSGCFAIAAAMFFSLEIKTVMIVLGGFFALSVTIKTLVSPLIARRYYRRHPAIGEPYCIEMLSDRVVISSARGRSQLKWDKIYQWRHDNNNVLIYVKPRYFYIVPKTLSSRGFDVEALVSTLQSRVVCSVQGRS